MSPPPAQTVILADTADPHLWHVPAAPLESTLPTRPQALDPLPVPIAALVSTAGLPLRPAPIASLADTSPTQPSALSFQHVPYAQLENTVAHLLQLYAPFAQVSQKTTLIILHDPHSNS